MFLKGELLLLVYLGMFFTPWYLKFQFSFLKKNKAYCLVRGSNSKTLEAKRDVIGQEQLDPEAPTS